MWRHSTAPECRRRRIEVDALGRHGYQVRLPVRGRMVTVVGGEAAAVRRVTGLLDAGANVLVVSAELRPELEALAAAGQIQVRRRGYQAADLDDSWLALACSSDPLVNAEVAADAARRRIWCPPAEEPGQRVLVLGGARSGKSTTAEAMLAGCGEVHFVATGPVPGTGDLEWDARVAEHRKRRPTGWLTTETLHIAPILADHAAPAPVLIDCLATWLARVMDECGVWDCSPDADTLLAGRAGALVASWRATSRRVVVVSNEVGSGVVPGTVSGRRFRDELGSLNAKMAALADEVWFCTAGIARRLR
jgi:adenosylcobinamide kinase/adenosylcobinamide-phosphate guanylyltransferase